MQAAYRQAVGVSVPSPYDKETPDAPWWWDHIAAQMQEWRNVGFTMILPPPCLKTASGAFPDADGYGTYDDYDAGSKLAFGSVETRFGSRERLARMVAIANRNGLDVLADVVLHQRSGGKNGTYNYPSADTKADGRFPKTPSCFVGLPPRVPRGDIDGPVSDDFGFGDELAPTTSIPKDYVKDGLIAAGQWLIESFGLDGFRIDDVKGMSHEFVHPYFKNTKAKFAVGEYYDGNPATLNWYVWESGMAGAISVFDFTAHFAVEAMCNNNSNFNMETLAHNGGFFQWSPFKAVTFVENPDTDTDGFATVIWNKVLGYAWILLSEGLPCVYYKDYSMDAGCYGLKPWIDNLIWIRQAFTDGVGTTIRYRDYQTYVFERNGKLLVALNNDQYSGWVYRTVATGFGANVQLHDYTGHAVNDVWTDAEGNVTIPIPPNDNGQSYGAWGRAGMQYTIEQPAKQTTQTFYGAADLDLGPAKNGLTTVGRVWCAAGSTIQTTIAQPPNGSISVNVVDDTDMEVLLSNLPKDGWYTLELLGSGLPTNGVPFALTVTYTAPEVLA
jgi:alpha-amylase